MQVCGGFEMARDQNSGHNREHSFATFIPDEILGDSLFFATSPWASAVNRRYPDLFDGLLSAVEH